MPTVIHGSCGVGTDTSQVTATANDVLEGKVIVDANGNAISGVIPVIEADTYNITTTGSVYTIPEGYHDGNGRVSVNISNLTAGNVRDGVTVGGVAGTFTSDATADTAKVLDGYTFYREGAKHEGIMVNRGAVTSSLTSQNSSYTIPQGYHSGSGKVTANITNLTAANIKYGATVGGVAGTFSNDATAVTNDVVSGKTFYRNGQKYTGAMSNRPMQTAAVSAVMSGGEVYLRIPGGAYMTVTSAGYPEVYMNLGTLFNNIQHEPIRHCNSRITNVQTDCNFRLGNSTAEYVAGTINKGAWVYKTTTVTNNGGINYNFCMVPCWVASQYLT